MRSIGLCYNKNGGSVIFPLVHFEIPVYSFEDEQDENLSLSDHSQCLDGAGCW